MVFPECYVLRIELNRVLPNRLQNHPQPADRLKCSTHISHQSVSWIYNLPIEVLPWVFWRLHHVEINPILIFLWNSIGLERLEHFWNVSWNVFGWGFRVILKHLLVIWRHISLNVIKSSCCWSLFRLFDIGRQTLIWLKFKKSHFEIEIYTMNIIPLSNVIELNIGSLNWILFRETIIDNDIKT